MEERQQENGAGVFLALMVLGFLLGGWLLRRVLVHEGSLARCPVGFPGTSEKFRTLDLYRLCE
jgi:hypothetical protein